MTWWVDGKFEKVNDRLDNLIEANGDLRERVAVLETSR